MKISVEKIFVIGCFVVAVIALYCYNPFLLYFQNDDFIHIPLSAKRELFQRNSFRPICDIVMIADYFFWKKSAVGYHISNLVLHAIACGLAYQLSLKTITKFALVKEPKLFSFTLLVLFFIYATHSEAVLWILGRSAILGFIFGAIFLLIYLDKREGFVRKFLFILCLIVALLTYESNFILPLLCCLFFTVDNKPGDRLNLLLVWITFAGYLLARFLVTGELLGTYEVAQLHQSLGGNILVNYLKLLYRGLMPAYSQPTWLLMFFGVLSLFLLLLIRNKPAKMFFLLYLISLLPYSLLGIDAHGYEGERYLYFPAYFIGFTLLLLIFSIKPLYLRYGLILCLLTIHTCSLYISAGNFRLAGKISKLTLDEINKLDEGKGVIIQNLPQSQNGALIMRSGFENAVQWLCNKNFKLVKVESYRNELKPFNRPFYIEHSKHQQAGNSASILTFTDSALYVHQ